MWSKNIFKNDFISVSKPSLPLRLIKRILWISLKLSMLQAIDFYDEYIRNVIHSKSYKSSAYTFFAALRSPLLSLVLYCRIVWLRTPILTSIDLISAIILIRDSLIFATGELSVIEPECSLVLALIIQSVPGFVQVFKRRYGSYRSFLSKLHSCCCNESIISWVLKIGFYIASRYRSCWSWSLFLIW